MHYIGMDCHITTLDFAVVNEAGRLVKADSVATSVNGFVNVRRKSTHCAGLKYTHFFKTKQSL